MRPHRSLVIALVLALVAVSVWSSAATTSTDATAAAPAAAPADAIPAKIACSALVQNAGLHNANVPDFSEIADASTRIASATVVPATATAPEYCDVKGYLATQITFELKLPTQTWQGRYLQAGCGGFCGAVSPTTFPKCDPPADGDFAIAATDDGHQTSASTDAMWAARDQQTREDFGTRAVHSLSVAAKQIQRAYYGAAPKISYFQGCSDGGREALMEAQRYPRDFTGIVAAAPANYMSIDPLWLGYLVDANTGRDGNAVLTADKLTPLHNAVVNACDGNDSVPGDGFVGDARDCGFDPGSVQCRGADGPDCLTAAQVGVVRKIYQGVVDDRGRLLDTRLVPKGSELSWAGWWVPLPAGADQPVGSPPVYIAKAFGENVARFLSYPLGQGKPLSDVKYTSAEFRTLAQSAPTYDAIDPDLTAFRDAGGKLLLYQGGADTLVPDSSTLDYFDAVTTRMGGRAETSKFARLFLINGMGHCGGGPTPDTSALVNQVVGWVERGRAPESIVVSDRNTVTNETRQRPVYPYPLVPKYVGPDPVAHPEAADQPGNFVAAPPAKEHNDNIDWLGDDLLKQRR